MDIKIEDETAQQQQPLLEDKNTKPPPKKPKTPTQKAVRKTFKGTTQLSKLLPTGSVLTFQILSPVLTHQGHCPTTTSQSLTLALLALSGLACFLLCFTDSCRDENGKIRHGVATFKGLWVLDGSVKLSEEEAEKYKLRFIDFFHAVLSLLVFFAVALFDKNIVKCFCPTPSEETKELIVGLPFWIGVVCSILFVAFPTKRHGIGSPLSRK
ncbi:hypothetical protein HS088_TW18G00051 [Tripterygium wilfordii]|uniref:Transmembrane protein n=1 Tax=Tripterygium wilfordii TaxID=458696 RepID=A0A7J7CB22_TRIWF|nr:protein DMP7 [Tripterygium wilfordii]KAF5731374.1 hypothetical protein HS088_TW18G00051 [Tripterygium wilfordii]